VERYLKQSPFRYLKGGPSGTCKVGPFRYLEGGPIIGLSLAYHCPWAIIGHGLSLPMAYHCHDYGAVVSYRLQSTGTGTGCTVLYSTVHWNRAVGYTSV